MANKKCYGQYKCWDCKWHENCPLYDILHSGRAFPLHSCTNYPVTTNTSFHRNEPTFFHATHFLLTNGASIFKLFALKAGVVPLPHMSNFSMQEKRPLK